MTLIIPTGFASCAWELTSTSGTAPFIFTLGLDISDFGGDHEQAANKAFFAWTTAFQTLTYEELTLQRTILSIGVDGPGGSVNSSLPPQQGSASGNPAALCLSTLVNKSTAQLGRRGRGRMNIPGLLSETEINESGIIDSASVGAIQDAVNTFAGYLIDDNEDGPPMAMYLLHSEAPSTPTILTGLQVQTKVGVLRKRIR